MVKELEWHQRFRIELRASAVPQDLENDLAVCVREVLLVWTGYEGAANVYQMQR